MNKFLLLLVLCPLCFCVNAQTPVANGTQPYGKVDTADLKLTACDFEKGSSAMVLFDKAEVGYKFSSIIMERHKRIKIFNDHARDEANIRIEYLGMHRDEEITDIEAETINLTDKTITYTPVDKKLIYNQVIDKDRKAIIFAFPEVRAGSIIEFKYKFSTPYSLNYPDWFFQTSIPTRYSEFNASFDEEIRFRFIKKIYQKAVIDTSMARTRPRGTRFIWALSNINAYANESYRDYPGDYMQRITFRPERHSRTWDELGKIMLEDEDFGQQLSKSISGTANIVAAANALNTDDEKVRYLFTTVKNQMKWNKRDAWYTVDGIKKAWDKKIGNSTEINLVLYQLLKSAGLRPFLMALKTRDRGWLNPEYPNLPQLNKTVVYYPVDSSKYYILDASDKYNSYNNIPYDLLGLNVLTIDPDNKRFGMFPLKPGWSKEVILVNGSISNEGKFEGSTQISSFSYNAEKYLRRYDDLSEKNYIEALQKENNELKISSFKMENTGDDNLPLIQTMTLKYNLTEPDGGYMYFNPNLLIGFQTNPFMPEARVADIDFRYLNNYSINERYKMPAGYKVDAIPKSVSLAMPDKGMNFKRVVAEQDGDIVIFCSISFKKTVFTTGEYPSLRDFYKKMLEMLNEQIVLKKI